MWDFKRLLIAVVSILFFILVVIVVVADINISSCTINSQDSCDEGARSE